MHYKTLRRIFKYTNVPTLPVENMQVRQSAKLLKDEIENYDEFVCRITASPYGHYLPETE